MKIHSLGSERARKQHHKLQTRKQIMSRLPSFNKHSYKDIGGKVKEIPMDLEDFTPEQLENYVKTNIKADDSVKDLLLYLLLK